MLCSFLYGCDDNNDREPIDKPTGTYVHQPDQPQFSIPPAYTARQHDVQRVDINRDGWDEAVLVVYADNALESRIGFDSLFVFEYQPDLKTFEPKFRQKYFFGRTVEARDIDQDMYPELLVFADGGGNDPVESRGLSVVSYKEGGYREVLVLDTGDPDALVLDSLGTMGVLVYAEYYPSELSHAESVRYLDSVIILQPLSAEQKAAVIQQTYLKELEKSRKEYATAKELYAGKQDEEAAFAVYTAAVHELLYLQKTGQVEEIKTFRTKEQKFWRGILPEEYLDALMTVFDSRQS